MKTILVLIAVLAILNVIYCSNSEIDLIMESMKNKPKKDMFKVFHFVHKKTYSLDSQEGFNRYRIFKQNLKWVEEKNNQLGKQIYGITQFMDMTDDELMKKYLMDTVIYEKNQKLLNEAIRVPQASENFQEKRNNFFELIEDYDEIIEQKVTQTPTSIDWTTIMNPAKDQGECGSCWAFAAVGAIEGNININFKTLPNLSEQYLLDCDIGNFACGGGDSAKAINFLKKYGTIDQTVSPYKASGRTQCKYSEYKSVSKNYVKGFSYCNKKEVAKQCTKDTWLNLLAKGPVAVSMSIADGSFFKYKPANGEAWIPSTCGTTLNHAVIAVGYVIENGIEYLKVRNSWGSNWGINGYFKIPVNKNCRIMDTAYLPEIQAPDTPYPEPYCGTFYSECNYQGKKFSTCQGVTDFDSAIGGKVSSFSRTDPKMVLAENFFDFYSQPECKGDKIRTSSAPFQCDANDYYFSKSSIKSVAAWYILSGFQCINVFDKPCYDGNNVMLCNAIPDLSAINVKISPGSIYYGWQFVKKYVFFDETNYKGNRYEYTELYVNTNLVPGLNEVLAKAKSLIIN